MAFVDTIRQLWQRKGLGGDSFRARRLRRDPHGLSGQHLAPGLHKRTLQVSAASSQILVDSPKSTLVSGGSTETFNALATRAKIYGQYLSSLEARRQIARKVGVPPRRFPPRARSARKPARAATKNQPSANEPANCSRRRRLPPRLLRQEGVPSSRSARRRRPPSARFPLRTLPSRSSPTTSPASRLKTSRSATGPPCASSARRRAARWEAPTARS